MSLHIRDLIALPELRSHLLSGADGLEREVRWAHVCELPDPSEWLGEGDVLMTTGLGVPAEPQAQREYVQRLADAGIAGMMIGEHMQAPDNLDALADCAQQLGFPVMLTEYGVPFAAVTRAIIDANQKEEYQRRSALARVYESARLSITGLSLAALVGRLEADIQCRLYVLVLETLLPWDEQLAPLPDTQRTALLASRPRHGEQQPMLRRHTLPQGEALSIELSTDQSCLLVVTGDRLPDYGLLHHLTAVLGLEVQRRQAERERRLRLGSELIDDLLHQRLGHEQANQRLHEQLPGLTLEQAVFSVARAPGLHGKTETLLRLLNERLLVRIQGEELILLHADGLQPLLSEQLDLNLGSSAPLQSLQRSAEALREALLACAHTHAQRRVCCFAELETDTPWLPRTPDEAMRAFRSVLGALHAYDQAHGTALLQTLQVFLEENRSWLHAAKRLHVHKQTLVYRIRRIETISGRSMDSTADVATLWFALQSRWVVADLPNTP
ncbi:PucR family transcriptional regulator [Pseudomonas arcuscaelestis]|uniref:PucR family transcriptional regulator n=1 Tax=Pseudomonas arcuscaelestis TaxID=2710591 RepID=UPI00193E186F|nr:PucR family transcriptional regulator [Pseudomonas arcuscaelestis]MBM3111409.1 PucR family transcriptional regulator [Pseudomonas arcuscaelestis]